jgi:RNA polymerase sigma-B factor
VTEELSTQDVEKLFRDFKRTGRRRDRNRLVEHHIGFAYYVAKRFSGRGVAAEDLQQTALLALVRAVDRFDPEMGAAFTSFAGPTIEGALKRHFRDHAWSVRVPRPAKELHLQVRVARDELGHELGRSPTVAEMAAHLDVSSDEIVQTLAVSGAFSPSSLEASSDDQQPTDRGGLLAEDDSGFVEVDDRMTVDELIGHLPEREREIVALRFYENLTQSEIAARVGISQMHVSRLLRRSLEIMRETSDRAVAGTPD